jgi:hypothetical protein
MNHGATRDMLHSFGDFDEVAQPLLHGKRLGGHSILKVTILAVLPEGARPPYLWQLCMKFTAKSYHVRVAPNLCFKGFGHKFMSSL